jgi:hypothetical protein
MGEDFKFWSTLLDHSESPILTIVLVVFGVGLTLSKKAAEIKGPLGAVARWWRTRHVRRIEHAQEAWRAQNVADEEQKDARIADLKEQVDYLKRVVKDVREELVIANARSDRNFGLLERVDCKVGTINAKLDHPSRLPVPRGASDTEPMKRVYEAAFRD